MVSLTNMVFANKTLCQALLLNKEIENVSFFFRRRYGSTEPAAWDRYERGDGKQEMNQVEGSKAQSLQPGKFVNM